MTTKYLLTAECAATRWKRQIVLKVHTIRGDESFAGWKGVENLFENLVSFCNIAIKGKSFMPDLDICSTETAYFTCFEFFICG